VQCFEMSSCHCHCDFFISCHLQVLLCYKHSVRRHLYCSEAYSTERHSGGLVGSDSSRRYTFGWVALPSGFAGKEKLPTSNSGYLPATVEDFASIIRKCKCFIERVDLSRYVNL